MNELGLLTSLFEAYRNHENSIPMQNYMKNQFPFLGIKAPERRELMKQFYMETDILIKELQIDLIELL